MNQFSDFLLELKCIEYAELLSNFLWVTAVDPRLEILGLQAEIKEFYYILKGIFVS